MLMECDVLCLLSKRLTLYIHRNNLSSFTKAEICSPPPSLIGKDILNVLIDYLGIGIEGVQKVFPKMCNIAMWVISS